MRRLELILVRANFPQAGGHAAVGRRITAYVRAHGGVMKSHLSCQEGMPMSDEEDAGGTRTASQAWCPRGLGATRPGGCHGGALRAVTARARAVAVEERRTSSRRRRSPSPPATGPTTGPAQACQTIKPGVTSAQQNLRAVAFNMTVLNYP